MSHDGRRSLPVLAENLGPQGAAPTLERARRMLGGPALSSAGAGRLVRVAIDGPAAFEGLGVVLHQSEGEVDVWVGGGVVRRTRPEHLTSVAPTSPDVDDSLLAVAADARVFGGIEAGARVLYQGPGGAAAEGVVVERCRGGALVARDDGSVLAVGFRKLWPREGRS